MSMYHCDISVTYFSKTRYDIAPMVELCIPMVNINSIKSYGYYMACKCG